VGDWEKNNGCMRDENCFLLENSLSTYVIRGSSGNVMYSSLSHICGDMDNEDLGNRDLLYIQLLSLPS
jgi:hypothetical protein